MKKYDKIQNYYEANMGKGLPDYGVLGWESEEAQKLRFDVLLSSVELSGKSILDIGCGMGNLLEYIEQKGISVVYTGVDILQSMISYAQCKKLKGQFCCIDIFDNNIFNKKSFDIIYSSGIFNLNLGNNKEFLIKALKTMLELSKETIAFNLLHKDSPGKEDKYFYFDPVEVKKLILDFDEVEKVDIFEQYLMNDFTVVVKCK
jgi:2-polyprenyl-3-methyl-5-hydroxy-6-metoxy-1,4-benzoquinol methylase